MTQRQRVPRFASAATPSAAMPCGKRDRRPGARSQTEAVRTALGCMALAAMVSCGSSKAPSTAFSPAAPDGGLEDTSSAAVSTGLDVDSRARNQEYVNDVLRLVSEMRELPATRNVVAQTIDRQTALAQIIDQVQRDLPPWMIEGEAMWLEAFGLIPRGYDYAGESIRLLTSQLAGYYDPVKDRMYILGDMDTEEARITLVHELVHALQEQHFGLGKLLELRAPGNTSGKAPVNAVDANSTDGRAAIHSLAEGDATSLMLDFSLRDRGGSSIQVGESILRRGLVASLEQSGEFSEYPRILGDSLAASYVDGLLLVHRARLRGGWTMVNELWKRPPQTTEQLLHWDKLQARELPRQVPVASKPASGQGWELVYSDVLGEQGTRLVASEWVSETVAAEMAAGWGGDRVSVFRHTSGAFASAWRIDFDLVDGPDREREARQWMEHLATVWQAGKGGALCHRASDSVLVAAVRHGFSVAVTSGVVVPGRYSAAEASTCPVVAAWAASVARGR